jgi:hypothetical protein
MIAGYRDLTRFKGQTMIQPQSAIGEPVVEYQRDDAARTATVTIGNLIRRHQQPHVHLHQDRDGGFSHVEIRNIHKDSEPVVEWQLADDGHPESITVSNICLARCADEPGRMSDVDIECHAIDMAVQALHERKQSLLMTPEQLEKQHAEARAALARLEKLRR